MICEWSQEFNRCLKTYPISDHCLDNDVATPLMSSQSKIKSISWNVEAKKHFLIGTQNSEILLMGPEGEVSVLQQVVLELFSLF